MAKPKVAPPRSKAKGKPKPAPRKPKPSAAAKPKPKPKPKVKVKPKSPGAKPKAAAKPKPAAKGKIRSAAKPPARAPRKAAKTAPAARAAKVSRPKAKAKPKPAPKPKAAPKPKPKAALKPKSAAKPKPQPKPPVVRKIKRVHFDAKTLASIKGSLIAERGELQEQLANIEESSLGASQAEWAGEGGYDEDYADAGTATFERERDLSIANNVQDLLDKIAKALDKIEAGSYGLCESCGDPISADRLKALPHVLMCIRCKKAEERR